MDGDLGFVEEEAFDMEGEESEEDEEEEEDEEDPDR